MRSAVGRFGMLLDVGLFVRNTICRRLSLALVVLAVCVVALRGAAAQAPQRSSGAPTGQQSPASPASPTPGAATPAPAAQSATAQPRAGLNIVVLDPAHGGTDLGA